MKPTLLLVFLLLAWTCCIQGKNNNDKKDKNNEDSSLACLSNNSAQVVLLSEKNNLILFTPGVLSAQVFKVSGVNGSLLAIDFRSTNGVLYGINNRKEIFEIDLSSGNATLASDLSDAEFKDQDLKMDFDPLNDSLRIISKSKLNYHVNVDIKNGTKGLTRDVNLQSSSSSSSNNSSNTNKNTKNNNNNNDDILGIAYSLNDTTGNATLYAIDRKGVRGRSRLVIIDDPVNNGTIVPQFKVKLPSPISNLDGFDIFTGKGCEVAVISQDEQFYQIDLQSGNITQVWKSTSKWLDNVFDLQLVDFTIVTNTASDSSASA